MDCERYPKVLLFELRYLATLRLPSEEALAARDRRWFAPLRAIRDAHHVGHDGDPWWLDSAALRLISGSLEVNKFAIVDGFLPEGDVAQLCGAVRRLYDSGEMLSGIAEQASSHGGCWGPENEGDFLNTAGEPRKWTLHGDYRAWCSDRDPRAPCFSRHTRLLDRLVGRLRSGQDSALAEGLSVETGRRLREVDFREYIMAVCYPGETRSRYLRHCDVSRGAVLTSILYLNEQWQPEDGGCLRIYWPGEQKARVKQDILPMAGRLVLFWASEEVPHEVLATKRDRFTMSIWLKTGKHALSGSNWLVDLLLRHQPVAPLSLGEAMRRGGADEASIRQAEGLQALLEGQPDEARKVALLQSLLRPEAQQKGSCTHCRRQDVDGRPGTDSYTGQFFCDACWEAWSHKLDQARRVTGGAFQAVNEHRDSQ